MYNYITEIKNYILFLKKECNLEITLHPQSNESLISNSELMVFNIHENAHCIYIKTFQAAHTHCIERQEKIREKCKKGAFCGTCYAGVKEYVYPIFDGEKNVGFVCVSGYKSENISSYIKACSDRFGIPIAHLNKSSLLFKDDMPEKLRIDTLIVPLMRMLELSYGKLGTFNGNRETIDKIISYVNRNYAQNISIDDICKEFSCSRSYVSHNFKKVTGKFFKEYLTEAKINCAKSLLSHSSLNITEIAMSIGFRNSNYFSNVFKEAVGVSPRNYRKQNRC